MFRLRKIRLTSIDLISSYYRSYVCDAWVIMPLVKAAEDFSTTLIYSFGYKVSSVTDCLHALFIPVLIGICSYKNALAIWGHSRWKLTLTQIVSLPAFPFLLTAILNSQAGCRCTLVPKLLFPGSVSPFPVPRSSFLVLVTSQNSVTHVSVGFRPP